MRKILALIICVILCFLSACKSSSVSEPSDQSASVSSEHNELIPDNVPVIDNSNGSVYIYRLSTDDFKDFNVAEAAHYLKDADDIEINPELISRMDEICGDQMNASFSSRVERSDVVLPYDLSDEFSYALQFRYPDGKTDLLIIRPEVEGIPVCNTLSSANNLMTRWDDDYISGYIGVTGNLYSEYLFVKDGRIIKFDNDSYDNVSKVSSALSVKSVKEINQSISDCYADMAGAMNITDTCVELIELAYVPMPGWNSDVRDFTEDIYLLPVWLIYISGRDLSDGHKVLYTCAVNAVTGNAINRSADERTNEYRGKWEN